MATSFYGLKTMSLEAPLASVFDYITLPVFNFDLSIMAAALLTISQWATTLWAVSQAFTLITQAWGFIGSFIMDHAMASIEFHSPDPIVAELKAYLCKQPWASQCMALRGFTSGDDVLKEEEDIEAIDSMGLQKEGNERPPNYAMDTKRRMYFIPGPKVVWFLFGKFRLRLAFEQSTIFIPHHQQSPTNCEGFTIRCFGRSSEPIKLFINEVRTWYHSRTVAKVKIYRPVSNVPSKFQWDLSNNRQPRSMESVILDANLKDHIITDIDRYLHPSSKNKCYKQGVAWRRGYVFHGPPGTGKTTLVTAIATKFGLPIYMLSLSEKTMGDQQLSNLLGRMHTRCILLIEDIDAAGLQRIQNSKDSNRMNLSFSGLLNAIDGVDSHEGHILIMTTNDLKLLDEALLRPGRVDHIITLPNANKIEAAELFKLFFGSEATTEDGKTFGTKVPDGLFSHSSIQNFLQRYPGEPKQALEDTPKWVNDAEAKCKADVVNEA
ncbi:P-loop containing nucleoside triphosphate hydrolase protein [Dactylonectria estremocensis]|uniref:P-loop containing nucleoside triphosphate hydrolase protein n=1 Tax=Dactylonectria estremocensis TaxID=1079267 RepID=A0A9P9IG72_9HYPO|nr:P-loop containing nucleoside triphosphate hydrolase protein [Dactylonectria estremocensis]